jgi:hypothetical protein
MVIISQAGLDNCCILATIGARVNGSGGYAPHFVEGLDGDRGLAYMGVQT